MLPVQQTSLLILPTCKGAEVINIDTIVRVEAISNYSKLYFSDGKTLVVAKVLRWFEQTLFAAAFVRVHRTHLVNTKFIHQYIKGDGDKIQLINGDAIDVSRRKKFLVQSIF